MPVLIYLPFFLLLPAAALCADGVGCQLALASPTRMALLVSRRNQSDLPTQGHAPFKNRQSADFSKKNIIFTFIYLVPITQSLFHQCFTEQMCLKDQGLLTTISFYELYTTCVRACVYNKNSRSVVIVAQKTRAQQGFLTARFQAAASKYGNIYFAPNELFQLHFIEGGWLADSFLYCYCCYDWWEGIEST